MKTLKRWWRIWFGGEKYIQENCEKILAALSDGRPHFVYNDLDILTDISFGSLYVALTRLEVQGLIRSGWRQSVRFDGHIGERRAYFLPSP